MDRMIQMIFNMVIRKVMNKGINAGVDRMTRGKGNPDQKQGQKPPQVGQDMKKRANMARRLGRF